LILIVADENHRGLDQALLSFQVNAQSEEWVTPEGPQSRPGECRPLSAAASLLFRLSLRDDLWINAEPGVVDENPAIHLPNINLDYPPL
jgi:hypothetical protein